MGRRRGRVPSRTQSVTFAFTVGLRGRSDSGLLEGSIGIRTRIRHRHRRECKEFTVIWKGRNLLRHALIMQRRPARSLARAGIPRRITVTDGRTERTRGTRGGEKALQFVARFDAKIAQLRPPMPPRKTQ